MQWGALISGVLGMLLFVLVPFMPVVQSTATVTWPQQGSLASIDSPLVSFAPESFEARVPLSLVAELPDEQGILLTTVPPDSSEASLRGLQVRATDQGVDVVALNIVPLHVTQETLDTYRDTAVLEISSTTDRTIVTLTGAGAETPDQSLVGEVERDLRPQVTGTYTDLSDTPAVRALAEESGLSVTVVTDSRFTTAPTVLKYLTMGAGLAALAVALTLLGRLDLTDNLSSKRILPQGWWKPRAVDGVVIATLGVWHVIGANTADDGYLLTMARASHASGYMANYYRWFGVPESPFGAPYYDFLALLSQVSTASMWMRLPTLIAAIACWLIISREIIPRLGSLAAARQVPTWTAAMVFLSFWIVFNNGLRPEPIIALGALLTWVSIERAIATGRLLPAAIGVICATLSLAAGPTGLMAVAALLAGLPALLRIVISRRERFGGGILAIVAQLAPFLAAGTAILIAVFGDQTLAAVLEAVRVRGEIGPNLHWYEEYTRYYLLLRETTDGSLTRRYAVLVFILSLIIVIGSMLRHGRVPGTAQGPALRLVLVTVGTMFFLAFSPTKWTHHFGVYAGIAAALAAMAAMAIGHTALQTKRNRTLFLAIMVFILALSAAGRNGWWYVGSYRVPWFDKPPSLQGVLAADVLFVVALIILLVGVWQHVRADYAEEKIPQASARRARIGALSAAPLAVISGLMVLFSVLSLAKGAVSQYPAYSLTLGNLRSVAGNHCMLANDVLVERDPNADFLTPVTGTLGESLTTTPERPGFEANGLPPLIIADDEWADGGIPSSELLGQNSTTSDSAQEAGTEGGTTAVEGVNGSFAKLPFDLDPAVVPVLGSFRDTLQIPAEATTQWYELPAYTESAPLLVVSAAGRIAYHDINGVYHYGQDLYLEFGREENGRTTTVGDGELLDIGPQPAWRNLRFDLKNTPEGANRVRIVAKDLNLTPEQWLAFTPPRVPEMETANDMLGSEDPQLLDWVVGLQFPCQRPFDHYAGIAEIPEYRITADRTNTLDGPRNWQAHHAGGPFGWSDSVATPEVISSYLRDNYHRDWGSLLRYVPRTYADGEPARRAEVDYGTKVISGWYSIGEMKTS